jgi:hypothetical protein
MNRTKYLKPLTDSTLIGPHTSECIKSNTPLDMCSLGGNGLQAYFPIAQPLQGSCLSVVNLSNPMTSYLKCPNDLSAFWHKDLVGLGNLAITNQNPLICCGFQLRPLLRRDVTITYTALDAKMTHIHPSTYKYHLRCQLPQHCVGTSVMNINSSATSLYLQKQWQTLIMYHRPFCSNYGHVLPLSHSIILRIVRNCEFLLDPRYCAIIHKLLGGVFTPTVGTQHPNLSANLVLNQSSKLLKFVKDFILSLQEVYLGLPGVVINE